MQVPIPYAVAMALSAGVAFTVAALAFQRRPELVARALALVMLSVAIWSGSLAGEALATEISTKILWSKLEYIGVAVFPFALLVFGLAYAERMHLLRPGLLPAYALIPTLTLILAWTNEAHHLLWVDVTRVGRPYPSMVRYLHGPWYWVNIGYTYTIAVLTAVLLLREAFLRWSTFRWQAVALLLAILPPLLLSTGYVFGWGALAAYDLTPIGFIVTGAVLVAGFTHRGILSLIPVACSRVLEYTHVAFLIIGADDLVLDVNPGMCKLLSSRDGGAGLRRDYVGRPITRVMEAWPEWCAHLEAVADDVAQIVAANAQHWEIVVVPVREEPGTRLVAIRDVTELVRLQAEAGRHRRREAALRERLIVERELQAQGAEVLRYVHSTVQVARALIDAGQPLDAQAELAEIDHTLMNAAADLRVLADSLRALPRLGQDFTNSLANYVDRLRDATGLDVLLSLPDVEIANLIGPPVAMALLRAIHEALTNVISHSQVGAAQVIVSRLGPWLQIVVADEGIGFDLLDAEARRPDGGLVEMRRRVEALDGSVDTRSLPGRGTQVVFQVPLTRDDVSPLFPPVGVLLVDDHPLILDGFADLLASRGAQVVGKAHTGREAVLLAPKLRPDLILMDIQMPDMTGIEATAAIKALLPETKIVMLTASRNKDDLVAAVRAGADGYLVKQLQVDEFIVLLAKIARDEAPIAPGLTHSLLQALVEMDVSGVPKAPNLDLPERQVTVLQRAAQGFTYREIGDQLHITERTVRYHVEQARETLGAASRAEAIAIASQAGLIDAANT